MAAIALLSTLNARFLMYLYLPTGCLVARYFTSFPYQRFNFVSVKDYNRTSWRVMC